jgi:hypothetical protein
VDRAILFRFHREPAVCRTRLELLRSLNPGVPIYGLGEPIGLDGAFEDLHVIEDRPPEWKWQHGDLAVADWYRAVGRERPFDVLRLVVDHRRGEVQTRRRLPPVARVRRPGTRIRRRGTVLSLPRGDLPPR